jgi:hypothetical protein
LHGRPVVVVGRISVNGWHAARWLSADECGTLPTSEVAMRLRIIHSGKSPRKQHTPTTMLRLAIARKLLLAQRESKLPPKSALMSWSGWGAAVGKMAVVEKLDCPRRPDCRDLFGDKNALFIQNEAAVLLLEKP